ncbi:MAG: PDR/VanB family oxidoreductase [Pseudomonadota bacterium]
MIVNPSSGKPQQPEPEFFEVKVARKSKLAESIYLFELVDPAGLPLPAFTAGSHITVETPGGMRRNYSLCNEPADASRYQIAIKRDAEGRGGSVSMADDVTEGASLKISAPRNNFELTERASKFLFIAGGIGITPIISMMRHLKASGNDNFRLIYSINRPESAAFLDELTGPSFAGQVEVHYHRGERDNVYDFWPVFETPTSEHIYCCGPRRLMEEVADMSGHWPTSSIHFESFGIDAAAYAANTPFKVKLQSSGLELEVSEDESILEALRSAGIKVPSSCESGTCGSCRTRLVSGEAEHRDMVLSEEEKESSIMVCVSRGKSPELVLDL